MRHRFRRWRGVGGLLVLLVGAALLNLGATVSPPAVGPDVSMVGTWQIIGGYSGVGFGTDGGHVVTLRAHRLVLMNAGSHLTVRVNAPADTTVNLNDNTASPDGATNGANPGGRDRKSTFDTNNWVYAYWIYHAGASSLNGILSTDNATIGPALPTGYTHWVFAGAFKRRGTDTGESNANGNIGGLKGMHVTGASHFYHSHVSVLYHAAATSYTTVDLSPFVPAHATTAFVRLRLRAQLTGGIIGANLTGTADLSTSATAGIASFTVECETKASTTTAQCVGVSEVTIPNVSSRIFFRHAATTLDGGGASTGAVTIDVRGFAMPSVGH